MNSDGSLCHVVDKVHLVGSSDRFGWDLYKSIECNLIQNSNLLILPTIHVRVLGDIESYPIMIEM
jgi:hypothetical protein